MRLQVPVTLGVALAVFATTASADFYNSTARNQSLRATAGQQAMAACSEAWAARSDTALNGIDTKWRQYLDTANDIAKGADDAVAEIDKDLANERRQRGAIEDQLADLTKGRGPGVAQLEVRRTKIEAAEATLNGITKRRIAIEAQLADPKAPVKDGFDARRTFGGSLGGADQADSSPRLADLQGQMNQVRADIANFNTAYPVLNPAPAPEETSIRAEIRRQLAVLNRQITAELQEVSRDPGRIGDLTRKRNDHSARIDNLLSALDTAREDARVARAFARAVERMAGVINECTRDQRAFLSRVARGGDIAGPTTNPPAGPVNGVLTGVLEADCGGVRRTGTISFRSDKLPALPGGGTYTSRLDWAFDGGPSGGLSSTPGMLTPEGRGLFSTVGAAGPANAHVYLAMLHPGPDGRTVVKVEGMLCGAVPGAGGHCRAHFWTPRGAASPAFPEELTCPAQP